MNTKSAAQFIVKHDCIVHSETGEKLPYLRIVAKMAKSASLTVVVEFDDASSRRRLEELSWPEYKTWSKFCHKMMSYAYPCNNLNLLRLLHRWYTNVNSIEITISELCAGGWWGENSNEGNSYYVNTNTIRMRRSRALAYFHKGSYAQSLRYELDISASDIASWNTELAPACSRSPALMVAILSALASTLLPEVTDLPSFCVFCGADEASDRDVIRHAAASVFGAPHNFSILGKAPTPLQLVADFRHGLVCCDIPDRATPKQTLSFFETLLGLSGEIDCVTLPRDMRLLALATGPHRRSDDVPKSIPVFSKVEPVLKLYDSLPGTFTPEQMNAKILFHAGQQQGGVGRKFVRFIEQRRSKLFQMWVKRVIHDFIEQRLQPQTKSERSRAQAIALLWLAGYVGIKWGILPWEVERLQSVLKQLFDAWCKPLLSLQILEEIAIEKLRQCLISANKLKLLGHGHKSDFTEDQKRDADLYLEGNYMYVLPARLSQWLPGQEGEIAIGYLCRRSLLEKNLPGRRTKAVQKTILGFRESFYGINYSFLAGDFAANPEVVDAGGGGDRVT